MVSGNTYVWREQKGKEEGLICETNFPLVWNTPIVATLWSLSVRTTGGLKVCSIAY